MFGIPAGGVTLIGAGGLGGIAAGATGAAGAETRLPAIGVGGMAVSLQWALVLVH